MLPRYIDLSISDPWVEYTKFISIPLLIGVPLALSWNLLGPIVKGFFIANLLSMLVVLGWLYIHAPIRLCNNYLQQEQILLGYIFLIIMFVGAGYWTIKAFIGQTKSVCMNT